MTSSEKKANRLAAETSPYLLQHAQNPVDWHAWNDESLQRAKAENKPILLSIGYSSCHWCHVMEHESFENAAIAKLMNENFINIKVDREERPDIDQIYQNVAQLMTRSGGWPLTVFLTPDLKPFFGGTYFPPEDRYGRPGFPRVLTALAEAFKNDPNSVAENANRLTDAISKLESVSNEINTKPDLTELKKIADQLLAHIDWRNGGLGHAPKFPSPMTFSFLWRWGTITQTGQAQDAVVLTLEKMARGGIYDQLGGGFHRYSVDESWSVPHFEKMLYDNGLLLKLYSEVLLSPLPHSVSEKERALFLKTIQETVDYVMREMADPETGAFYSAQDADSEGREGAFFVWSKNNFVDILVKNGFSETDSLALANHFGVTEAGNFEHTNETVLWTSPQEALDRHDLVAKARSVLFAERERREKPFRDEKSLTGWNALMISGLVWASLALKRHGDPARANEAHQAAQRAFDFLRTTLSQSSNHLWATAKDGKAKIEGFLDDYAFATTAAIDMARLGHLDAIDLAAQWNETIWKEFLDDTGTGFYFTSSRHERLIARPKTIYDQAIPSGTATTLWNSLLLAELRADSALAAKAEDVLFRLFTPLLNSAHGMAELANASLLWLCSPGVVNFELKELHPFWLVKGNESVDQKKTVCQRQSCVAAPANFSLQEALLRSLK